VEGGVCRQTAGQPSQLGSLFGAAGSGASAADVPRRCRDSGEWHGQANRGAARGRLSHGQKPEGWDTIPGARGCSAEACGFQDHHDELLDVGASRVFGVSAQDSGYQQEVVARLRLPFALLSDTELRLVRELNLPTFQAGGRTLFKRLTLVIADGVIEHAFYPVFPPNEHAQQVLTWLRSRPHTAPGERSQQAPRPQPHGC